MREIKFRGKTRDNEKWIYGDLIHYNYNNLRILPQNKRCWYVQYVGLEVIPESVGQYTGIKDKNGKEIYEGDVLGYDGEPVGTVEWVETLEFIVNAEFTGEGIMNLYHAMYNSNRELEVIGNIYDNPELLKRE